MSYLELGAIVASFIVLFVVFARRILLHFDNRKHSVKVRIPSVNETSLYYSLSQPATLTNSDLNFCDMTDASLPDIHNVTFLDVMRTDSSDSNVAYLRTTYKREGEPLAQAFVASYDKRDDGQDEALSRVHQYIISKLSSGD